MLSLSVVGFCLFFFFFFSFSTTGCFVGSGIKKREFQHYKYSNIATVEFYVNLASIALFVPIFYLFSDGGLFECVVEIWNFSLLHKFFFFVLICLSYVRFIVATDLIHLFSSKGHVALDISWIMLLYIICTSSLYSPSSDVSSIGLLSFLSIAVLVFVQIREYKKKSREEKKREENKFYINYV